MVFAIILLALEMIFCVTHFTAKTVFSWYCSCVINIVYEYRPIMQLSLLRITKLARNAAEGDLSDVSRRSTYYTPTFTQWRLLSLLYAVKSSTNNLECVKLAIACITDTRHAPADNLSRLCKGSSFMQRSEIPSIVAGNVCWTSLRLFLDRSMYHTMVVSKVMQLGKMRQ